MDRQIDYSNVQKTKSENYYKKKKKIGKYNV